MSLALQPAEGASPISVERLERTVVLCVGLVLTPFVPILGGMPLINWVLWFLALMTQITAGQRFLRRWRAFRDLE